MEAYEVTRAYHLSREYSALVTLREDIVKYDKIGWHMFLTC